MPIMGWNGILTSSSKEMLLMGLSINGQYEERYKIILLAVEMTRTANWPLMG